VSPLMPKHVTTRERHARDQIVKRYFLQEEMWNDPHFILYLNWKRRRKHRERL